MENSNTFIENIHSLKNIKTCIKFHNNSYYEIRINNTTHLVDKSLINDYIYGMESLLEEIKDEVFK